MAGASSLFVAGPKQCTAPSIYRRLFSSSFRSVPSFTLPSSSSIARRIMTENSGQRRMVPSSSSFATVTCDNAAVDDTSPTVIGYVTDVEGDLDFWNRYVYHSAILSRTAPAAIPEKIKCDDKSVGDVHGEVQKGDAVVGAAADGGRLKLLDGAHFVFGGDAVDHGSGDLRFLSELLRLKEDYPSRVHLLLGNRDINKMRLADELSERHRLKYPFVGAGHPDVYWGRIRRERARKRQAKEQEEKEDKKENENKAGGGKQSKAEEEKHWISQEVEAEAQRLNPSSLHFTDSAATRLRWILAHTMGCPNTFELRRKELEEVERQRQGEKKRGHGRVCEWDREGEKEEIRTGERGKGTDDGSGNGVELEGERERESNLLQRESGEKRREPKGGEPNITDEKVVRSFVDSLGPNGLMRRYLEYGELAVVLGDTLFVHGALGPETVSVLPPTCPLTAGASVSLHAASVSSDNLDVRTWASYLNEWASREVEAWTTYVDRHHYVSSLPIETEREQQKEMSKEREENRVLKESLKNDENDKEYNAEYAREEEAGGEAEYNGGAWALEATGDCVEDSKSFPGSGLMAFGMRTRADGSVGATVVYRDWIDADSGRPRVLEQPLVDWLTSSGIRHVVSGHRPHGDVPLVLRHPFTSIASQDHPFTRSKKENLMIITLDTSYSGDVIVEEDWPFLSISREKVTRKGAEKETGQGKERTRERPRKNEKHEGSMRDRRGDAVSELLLFNMESESEEIPVSLSPSPSSSRRFKAFIHGVTSCGRPYEAFLEEPPDSNLIGREWTGKEVGEERGWWVKARLINGAKISSGKRGEALEEENGDDYYIVSRLVLPYDVENRIIRVPRSG